MPIYGASMTKQFMYHGQVEQFSNVYHYESGVFDSVVANALLDQILSEERKVHTSAVRFLVGRVWEAGGTPAQNQMILVRDFTEFGLMAASSKIHRAAAVVVKLFLGRKSTTGRKIYLRKHLHAEGLPSSVTAESVGESILSSVNKAPFIAYGNAIKNFTVAAIPGGARLVSPDGTGLPVGTNAEVKDGLSIRQFRA